MANEVTGLDFIVSVREAGSQASDPYTRIGGQRNVSRQRTRETVNAGNKDSGGAAVNLSTGRNWGINMDGVYQTGDGGLALVEEAYESDESAIEIELEYPDGSKETGLATVANLDVQGPWDAEATYSIEFQARGKLTKTPAGG